MNYGNIKECDIADGPGVRVSLSYQAADITAKAALMQRHGISDSAITIQKRQKQKY